MNQNVNVLNDNCVSDSHKEFRYTYILNQNKPKYNVERHSLLGYISFY